MNTLLLIRRDFSRVKRAREVVAQFYGLWGDAWKLEGTLVPTLPVDAARWSEWKASAEAEQLCAAVAFDLGEEACVSHFHGYDVGFVTENWGLYSSILNDVLVRDVETLPVYRKCLNRYGLFEDRQSAQRYLADRQALLRAGANLERDSYPGEIKVWGLGCPFETPEPLALHPPVTE